MIMLTHVSYEFHGGASYLNSILFMNHVNVHPTYNPCDLLILYKCCLCCVCNIISPNLFFAYLRMKVNVETVKIKFNGISEYTHVCRQTGHVLLSNHEWIPAVFSVQIDGFIGLHGYCILWIDQDSSGQCMSHTYPSVLHDSLYTEELGSPKLAV